MEQPFSPAGPIGSPGAAVRAAPITDLELAAEATPP
jgi:hypothetical protein